MLDFLDALFAGWRWYRRRRGGHWEHWFRESAHMAIWVRMPWCTEEQDTDYLAFRVANPDVRGHPTCEDYR